MSIYQPLEHLGIPWVLQAAVLAAVLLILAGLRLRRQIATAPGGALVPDEGLTLRNVLEIIVEALAGLARQNMGHEWRTYFPLVATIFIFVLLSNLFNLVPGVLGATYDINTTAAWALIAASVGEWAGIRKHGWNYVKHFIGPAFEMKLFGKQRHFYPLAIIFVPLELVGHIARVLTLSIRLLANMYADHTLVTIWLGLVPFLVPAVFLGLGVIVCVLQAFVFSLLTMVYIGLALAEAH